MTPKKEAAVMAPNGPWWLRVLEHQGLPTVFALILLAGGWRVAEAHLRFIESQSIQMALQTKSLEAIVGSNVRQEHALGNLKITIDTAIRDRKVDHGEIIDKLRDK